MMLDGFAPFVGQHCETTATGSLLKHLGIHFSEPLLFGIGEGLGFLFWKMKTMSFPFIGGRVKTSKLTENICNNLALQLEVKETSSVRKAWENVVEPLSHGKPVGLKLDSFYLDYFTNKIHFAGHYTAMYGYDEEFAYLNDTHQQGGQVKASLRNLTLARDARGPMSSRNMSYTIEQVYELPELAPVIKRAIYKNACDFLNPPIRNLGYKGIQKTAAEIVKWYRNSEDVAGEFSTSAMLMERAGTGGALFRNLYRDFLHEAFEIVGLKELKEGYHDYCKYAMQWREISDLFLRIAESKDYRNLERASVLFAALSEGERATMERLRKACQ